jgi:hypothetical protein
VVASDAGAYETARSRVASSVRIRADLVSAEQVSELDLRDERASPVLAA